MYIKTMLFITHFFPTLLITCLFLQEAQTPFPFFSLSCYTNPNHPTSSFSSIFLCEVPQAHKYRIKASCSLMSLLSV